MGRVGEESLEGRWQPFLISFQWERMPQAMEVFDRLSAAPNSVSTSGAGSFAINSRAPSVDFSTRVHDCAIANGDAGSGKEL